MSVDPVDRIRTDRVRIEQSIRIKNTMTFLNHWTWWVLIMSFYGADLWWIRCLEQWRSDFNLIFDGYFNSKTGQVCQWFEKQQQAKKTKGTKRSIKGNRASSRNSKPKRSKMDKKSFSTAVDTKNEQVPVANEEKNNSNLCNTASTASSTACSVIKPAETFWNYMKKHVDDSEDSMKIQ